MRFSGCTQQQQIDEETLQLKLWQNLQIARSLDDNYINRLLESTRKLLVQSEELAVENEAISSAINHYGLSPMSIFTDSPSTSSQSTPPPRKHTSSSSSSTSSVELTDPFESAAIDSAIFSYGLQQKPN